MTTYLFLLLVLTLGFAVGALCALSWRPKTTPPVATNRFEARTGFLFEGEDLVDATPIGHQLLSGLSTFNSSRSNLIALCKAEYPDLEDVWSNIETLGSKVLRDSSTSSCSLEIAKVGERVSIRLLDGPEIRGQTIQEELFAGRVKFLSEVIDQSPDLIWKEASSGDVLWSNRKYRDLLIEMGSLHSEIDPRLIKQRVFNELAPPDEEAMFATESKQVIEDPQHKEERWFNVVSFPTPDGSLHYAADANEAVSAKTTLRSSLRTFVQIFAQLSIGFAIFDENRQLVIYNPSIVELTGLDPVFLSSKPTLLRMIEEMRRTDRAPEPKSFGDFRKTIRQLEQAAANGTYEAVWTLTDGQSLRVTGRPYQSGSLAVLIEDVSSDLALTRRHRTEIQAHQDVLDTREEPIFVFSNSNTLVSRNASAGELSASEAREPSNLDQFSEFLNRSKLPGPPITSLQIESMERSNIHFADGRSFEIRKHALSSGFFCLVLKLRRSTVGSIPQVVERTKGARA